MNKFCDLTGVGLIPWGPLARGFLARPFEGQVATTERSRVEYGAKAEMGNIMYPPPITEADEAIIGRVKELSERKRWCMSQVALAWINKRISSPIIGFSSVQRMEEAVEAKGKSLSEEEENFLEEVYVNRGICGHV